MRLLVMLVAVAIGCGGTSSSNDCGAIAGQDCGAQMTVTMKYGGGAAGNCSVTKKMSAEQFYWAVVPTYTANSCGFAEQSATTAVVDCSTRALPPGCNAGAVCDWQPPVLR